jgi:hypothetical protein
VVIAVRVRCVRQAAFLHDDHHDDHHDRAASLDAAG